MPILKMPLFPVKHRKVRSAEFQHRSVPPLNEYFGQFPAVNEIPLEVTGMQLPVAVAPASSAAFFSAPASTRALTTES